ncbi:hypothetical protein EON65_11950 [archaeon]|nr:MAG: hypothetical protein EON65_11950 [archaeon]
MKKDNSKALTKTEAILKTRAPNTYQPASSLKGLMAAPKGYIEYVNGYSFLLHVSWEAPSLAAANELLAGLQQCASATHRDTPCVSTYFFRISSNDTELCEESILVCEHPQINAAKKKLQHGVSPLALHAELIKRGIDIALLEADPNSKLPLNQQLHPVAVEFTEVYLDDRAFFEHSGSRDFLDGYAVVMNPAMHNKIPQTVRLGTPSDNVIEKILEPILHESLFPLLDDCIIWRSPTLYMEKPAGKACSAFLSLDFAVSDERTIDEVVSALPLQLREHSTTCVAFPHPLRANTVRVMCVLALVPSTATLTDLAGLHPLRGEIHIHERPNNEIQGAAVVGEEEVREVLTQLGLSAVILVNVSSSSGYILHDKAFDVFGQ